MKKLLAIFGFLAISLLSTDHAIAQEKKMNFQAIAKNKTHEITKQFKLDAASQRVVYNAYMLRERKLAAMQNNTKVIDTKEIDAELDTQLKSVLSEDQMKTLKHMEMNKAKNQKIKK